LLIVIGVNKLIVEGLEGVAISLLHVTEQEITGQSITMINTISVSQNSGISSCALRNIVKEFLKDTFVLGY